MTHGGSSDCWSPQSRYIAGFLAGLFLLGVLGLTSGCSGAAGQRRPQPTSATASGPTMSSSASALSNAVFDFQEDVGETKDDLSALGAQQDSLPLDLIDIENDYGSLQDDLLALQVDQLSNNPNDACNDASQGLIGRESLYSDQTAYGGDVSLATADMGRLDEDVNNVRKSFSKVEAEARQARASVPGATRSELRSVLAANQKAQRRMAASIAADNPMVTKDVKSGDAIYRKLQSACAAVR